MTIDLLSLDQILELFEPRKGPILENLGSHIDSFEKIIELLGALLGVPSAGKPREMFSDFIERHTIAPIVRTGTKSQTAAREGRGDDFTNFLYPVIVIVISNVEDLVVNSFYWGLQGSNNGPTNIQSVD